MSNDDEHNELSLTQMEDHRPYTDKLGAEEYEVELRALQIELLKLQRHVRESGREGRHSLRGA